MIRASVALALLASIGCSGPVPGTGKVASPANDTPAWPDGGGASIRIDSQAAQLFAPPQGFAELETVLAAPDGGLIAADAGSQQIFVFAPDGSIRRSFGRAGDGPGEYRYPQLVPSVRPDSIIVVEDYVLRRITWLNQEGQVLSMLSTNELGLEGRVWAVCRLSDGRLLLRVVEASGRVEKGFVRIPARLYLLDPQTRRRTLLFEGTDHLQHPNGYFWFGWRLWIATAADRIYTGTGETASIDVLDLDGSAVGRVTWNTRPRPVGDAERTEVRQLAATRRAPPEVTGADRFANVVPVYGRLLVDETGHLWAFDYTASYSSPGAATVFDPMGRWLGAIAVPRGFSPRVIDGDWIVGVHREEDGVARATRFPIRRSQGS